MPLRFVFVKSVFFNSVPIKILSDKFVSTIDEFDKSISEITMSSKSSLDKFLSDMSMPIKLESSACPSNNLVTLNASIICPSMFLK